MDGDWRLVMADETKLLVSLHTPYCLSRPVPATSDGGETCNIWFHRANSSTAFYFAKPEDTLTIIITKHHRTQELIMTIIQM
jgi:hypothetical protein